MRRDRVDSMATTKSARQRANAPGPALGTEVQVQNDPNEARKRSEAAKKAAATRAKQKHAREQWERRQNEPAPTREPEPDDVLLWLGGFEEDEDV